MLGGALKKGRGRWQLAGLRSPTVGSLYRSMLHDRKMVEDENPEPVLAFVAGDRSLRIEGMSAMAAGTCIVAFVDLLGFKEMVRSDPTGDVILPLVERSIADGLFYAQISGQAIPELKYRIFSDNICFWMDLQQSALAVSLMLATVSEFQLRLALNGILCRGGMAIGPHRASENVLYGPALVEAVELEKQAIYPRIVISDQVITLYPYLLSVAAFYYQIHRLQDEKWFVNYLWGIYFKDKEEGVQELAKHSAVIVEAIKQYADVPRVRSKYEWARDYHNDAVGHLKHCTPEMIIPLP